MNYRPAYPIPRTLALVPVFTNPGAGVAMLMSMSEKAPFTEYRIFGVLGNLAVGEP
jgi:hypothetical protein